MWSEPPLLLLRLLARQYSEAQKVVLSCEADMALRPGGLSFQRRRSAPQAAAHAAPLSHASHAQADAGEVFVLAIGLLRLIMNLN